jgi:hypothetical protein
MHCTDSPYRYSQCPYSTSCMTLLQARHQGKPDRNRTPFSSFERAGIEAYHSLHCATLDKPQICLRIHHKQRGSVLTVSDFTNPETPNLTSPGVYILALLPCALFRFVVFAPFGFYWAHATTHWDIIEQHTELSKGIYDPAIAAGEKIASDWGTVAFYWNFAVWIPCLWCPPPLNLPFMVMDILITVYLSKATHYQTGYAPHSKGACGGPTGAAYTWHRPTGANESFFEAAGRLNATVATPVNMCRSFAEEWQFGVALS